MGEHTPLSPSVRLPSPLLPFSPSPVLFSLQPFSNIYHSPACQASVRRKEFEQQAVLHPALFRERYLIEGGISWQRTNPINQTQGSAAADLRQTETRRKEEDEFIRSSAPSARGSNQGVSYR